MELRKIIWIVALIAGFPGFVFISTKVIWRGFAEMKELLKVGGVGLGSGSRFQISPGVLLPFLPEFILVQPHPVHRDFPKPQRVGRRIFL